MMTRTLIIGLDGATWDILMPLIEKNKLPTFKKLLENGVHGPLESTIPPVTGPSWLSFATGKNPGKTGIYDFLNRNDIDLRLKPVSSKSYQGQSIWDYLTINDYKVGVVAYPNLYPPYPTNNFMISGIGAPLGGNITYPKKLREEIDDVSKGYELVISYHNVKYNNMELFIRDVNRLIDKQFKIALHLLETKDWNFFIYICSATDWIQHIMWKHIDRDHPWHDQKISPKYAEEFEKFFKKIDAFLNKLLDFNVNLLIVSDHGFGPEDQCFNLTEWLERKGYLKIKKVNPRFKNLKTKSLQTLTFVNRLFRLKKFIPNTLANRVSRTLSTNIADLIDFDRSVAYCLGHTIPFGGIYIKPSIKNSDKYHTIKMKIVNDLQRLSDDVGKHLETTIYDPEKIYTGNKIHLAPDIIFTINNWRCVILEENFNRPLFEEKPFSNRHTGSHRMAGIFVAYGQDIKKGVKILNVKIYDIAPTILYMFSIPIPRDMDGRVLKEIFKSDSKLAKREPKYVDPTYYKRKQEEENLRKAIKKLKLKEKIFL